MPFLPSAFKLPRTSMRCSCAAVSKRNGVWPKIVWKWMHAPRKGVETLSCQNNSLLGSSSAKVSATLPNSSGGQKNLPLTSFSSDIQDCETATWWQPFRISSIVHTHASVNSIILMSCNIWGGSIQLLISPPVSQNSLCQDLSEVYHFVPVIVKFDSSSGLWIRPERTESRRKMVKAR